MSDVFTAGKLKPAVQGDKIADTTDLAGAYVKSVNDEGTVVTQQDADGQEVERDLSNGLSDAEHHDLNATPGLIAKTADLKVEVVGERVWGNVTDLAEGGFVSEDSGNLGPVHAAVLAYVLSKLATSADANNNFVYIRIPVARDSRDYRIRQNGSLGEFFITSWDHVGVHENFDYFRSRHNLFATYAVTIQFDSAAATQTHFRGVTDADKVIVDATGFDGNLAPTDVDVQKVAQKVDDLDLSRVGAFTVADEAKLDSIQAGARTSHQLDPTQANDGDSDVFGEISGELVAGAIDAHHTTQHTWLTELRLDFRNPQAGIEPQFRILFVSVPTTHNRILEFSQLNADDIKFIQSIIQGAIVNVGGSLFTVFASVASGTDLWLQGEFNATPTLVDGQNYRLRFTASRPIENDAIDIDVDTASLDGNLNGVSSNVQAMLEAVDDFSLVGQGASNWSELPGRPDRPTPAELAAGVNTDEAVPSVSDVVALVNSHRLVRSNEDPANIDNAAAEGVEAEVSRHDHTHRFPHDSTIEYDDVNEQFGVNVHDVIEHLQESIEYYEDSPYDYSTGGGPSEGQVYTTSAFQKTISRVRIRFIPASSSTRYEARILQVHDDNRVHSLLGTSRFRTLDAGGSHHFDFEDSNGEVGIPIVGGARIAIVLSRLGGGIASLNHGTESGNSPRESYDDASQDFVLQNSVVYDHENPPVDQGTHSHGDHNDIRGNIEIFYTLTYRHGRFVGDNFDLSDAIPQPNTADGAAGSSEEASRADHAHPGVATSGILATRMAGILDVTDSDVWVEAANYDDTTKLVGADRTARYMSWFDGNLYLADTAGNVNTRAFGGAITGMARGNGLFVTLEGNNFISRSAVDLAQLDSAPFGTRHAVAVQEDNPTKFWSLGQNANGTIAIREVTVASDGTIGAETTRHTITVDAMNAALGARYFDAASIYVPNSGDGIVDLYVVSASEFWIIFAGLPLAHDLTTEFTVMVKAEVVPGSNTFELIAGSAEDFARDDGRSFVRIGDGLVYLGYDDGVARYEKKSARAEVYREHQQDRLPRITQDEKDAGAEDAIREMSPIDVHDMIDTHGGGGGMAGAGGFDRNILFRDESDRAGVVSNGSPVVLALNRQPIAGSSMRIEFRENSGSIGVPVNATYIIDPIPSDLWLFLDPITGSPSNPNNMMAFILKRPNSAFTTTGLVTYIWVGRTTDGEMVLRCGAMVEFNLNFRITVREIVPTSGGGVGQQIDDVSGRILRTRTLVAADTLIAANNFGFDLSGNDELALGRYALNPTLRANIFDFVATIRVGSRAGFPIRLSKEQFDYVGEYDIQNTWPFGGTGGGSWGNVTEIPCAMMYIDHRSEGVVKTQLKPQRQQINWSISGTEPRTSVLFFFSYNTSGSVDFVEMIVFTDQVVQIEGMHFHYWENV